MTDKPITQEAILHDLPRLGPEDRFAFRCDAGLDCFTRCCQDVAIVLTPYDVLRMKQALGIDSSEFLRRYTISPFTPEQKIPAVLLRMDPESKRCPLVSEAGCSIYEHRPWSCRMYPLGLAEPRTPTSEERRFHFLVREEICHGHDQGPGCTVLEWTSGQGLEEYEMNGASFKALMLHEFWEQEEALTPEAMEMYFMACYDLDRFRRFVLESRFLECFEVDEARVAAIARDDEELLEFAMLWLRFTLFHERTMRLKPSVLQERTAAGAVANAPRGAGDRGAGREGREVR